MLEFMQNIAETLLSIVRFVGNLVASLVNFFAILPQMANFTNTAASFLPTFLVNFFVLGVALLIVKVILDLL